MTLVGVFASVTDRRTGLMVQIEAFLDNELGRNFASTGGPAVAGGIGGVPQLERVVAGFGDTVAQLQQSVAQFDNALQTFALTTRDFREFNLHLKDNVQRMSLSFGDFSESLKQQVNALKARH
jgi:methyl-accepting chemotaxis protein